ncbi:Pycsar system effector family protein [Flavobacterium degerlachei]|jgi:predicted metal-dependent HD superfamily phosphohydrolase|uniref:HD domain-containing protein n=1 Tax=Flavobacterium degerlachei TaxID=229203 RepID=A0A1H3AAA1_9FLAO|nr:Pycsar system effector family protein [Flavobacterium degerlachei]SDX26662.1 HD domain-containing protein [Flavobacterium degerlachei]
MDLIEQAEDFVCKLLKDKLSNSFTYHNIKHTKNVVNAVEVLCEKEALNQIDKELVLVAAWFHDTGYIYGCENHELSSVSIVIDFLKEKEKSNEYIDTVSSIIKATTFDYVPKTILEKIIRDADYSHFANSDYLKVCELLRTEWVNTQKKIFSDFEWANENYRILSVCHKYYTDYAIANWTPLKEININLVHNKIKTMEERLEEIPKIIKDKKKKSKSKKPDRGIDTLFRITLSNHTRLSGIADSKANILLSVNAIIISIALSSIIPKLDSVGNAHLVMPTFVMLMFSVTSIIFAILSTRPKVTSGVFTRQDIEDRKVNLLFFGNFYKMPLEEYEWAVNEMMKDNEYLYNSMIKDLYFLGIVLEKKYRLLRITYNIFMIGIIVSVAAFVFAFYSVKG